MDIAINIEGLDRDLDKELIVQLSDIADKVKKYRTTCKCEIFSNKFLSSVYINCVKLKIGESKAGKGATYAFYDNDSQDLVWIANKEIYYANLSFQHISCAKTEKSSSLEKLLLHDLRTTNPNMIHYIIKAVKQSMRSGA